MEPVAFRWRTQIEKAQKIWRSSLASGDDHNELVGWVSRGGTPKIRIAAGDRADHPQIQRRFELTREVIAAKAGVVHEVWSEGDSPLSRVLSAICLGDYVSLYMAYLNGVDPTPVEIIDYLKKNLA
jgi:glucose/mannose-6-phosphate isomerase